MSALLRLFVVFTLLLSCSMGRAAPAASAPEKSADAAVTTAPLSVAGRIVFTFRSPIAGFGVQDRADGARKRLDKALAAGGPQHASVRAIDAGTQVLLDGHLLFLVTKGDINPLADDTTEQIASDSAAALNRALAEKRAQGTSRYWLEAGVWCLVATAAYVALLRALTLLHRRIRAYTRRSVSQRLERIRFRDVELLDADYFVHFIRQVSGVVVWSLRLVATFLWLSFILGHIPYFQSWGERLREYLIATLIDMGTNALHAIPGLLVAVVIAAIARLAILTAGSILKRVESGELAVGWLDRDTAPPTRRLVNVAIILFALAMAYPYLPGAHTAAFQGVTVLAGLMVSIGGSSLVAQGASGLILMYTRTLRKGEYVRIGETEGTVEELGMFETRVRTGLGAEVSLPNALVLANTTKNYSRTCPSADYLLEIAVTVGYDSSWREVHVLLKQAARETDGVMAEPAPFVAQTALSDFYVQYRLVAPARAETARDRVDLQTRLHGRILDLFDGAGIAMTSPHFTQEPLLAQANSVANTPRSQRFDASS